MCGGYWMIEYIIIVYNVHVDINETKCDVL